MTGIYIYCIREKNPSALFSAKGFDLQNKIYAIPYKEIEAVVSGVRLEEFNSEEIKIKAQENLNWITEKIMIHENAAEDAMKKNGKVISIIPMKFGTIFADEKKLIETLDRHYAQFKTALDKLDGKEEWSVKVYLSDKSRFEKQIKSESKIINETERQIAELPEGMAYFQESELKEVISNESEKKLNQIKEDTFDKMKLYAEDAKQCKLLQKEITGRVEPMILNSSYLIKTERVNEFKQKAESKNKELNSIGLTLEFFGPWPPYYFSEQYV